MSFKAKKSRKKLKYSRFSCILWALKNLWRIDKWFVFFIFATVPVTVAIPLLNSYFSKYLIDSIGGGETFSKLACIVVFLVTAQILLQILDQFIKTRCQSRDYYPTGIFQSEMSAFSGYDIDYENTEKQDFKKVEGYA